MIDIDRVIRDTRELVAIESTNPGRLEAECGEWVQRRLSALGLEVTRHPVQPGRDNLSVLVPGTQSDLPRLVLVSHMDTVPVGNGWTRDPFGGEIADGKLYGRGACDMKAGLAVTIGLLDGLLTSGARPPMDILAIYTVDEEAPGMLGAHQIVADGLLRPEDQILALEPSGMRLRIAQMGLRWLALRVHGRMAHAGRAHLGINAVQIVAEIIHDVDTTFRGLPFDDPILGRARFTCSVVTGGISTNVVPPLCEAELDVRVVPPLMPQDAISIIRNIASDVVSRYHGASFELVPLGAARPAVRASSESLIIRSLRSSFERVTGSEPGVGGADGHEAYTDSAMIAALTGSRSSTVLGPGATDQAHTADEYVAINDIELAGRVLWDVTENWASMSAANAQGGTR